MDPNFQPNVRGTVGRGEEDQPRELQPDQGGSTQPRARTTIRGHP